MTDTSQGDVLPWDDIATPAREPGLPPRCIHLTDAFAASVSLPETHSEWWVRDTEEPLLHLRLRRTSNRFYVRARALDEWSDPLKEPIGIVGQMSCEEARRIASELAQMRHLGVTLPSEAGLTPISVGDAYEKYARSFAPSRHWQRDDSLMRRFVLPSLGSKRLSTLGRFDFVACLKAAALRGRTPVTVLYKRLRAFLYWATDRNFVHANPLARLAPPVAQRRKQVLLHAKTLGQIYVASREMSWPWSGMIGLLFLVQLNVSAARRVQACDVNWTDQTICPLGCDRSNAAHWEAVSEMAFYAIAPGRDAKGFLFQSPLSDGPYDLRSNIRYELQERAGTSTRWTWSDLVRSIRVAFDAFKDQRAPAGDSTEAQRQLQNAWVEELLRLNDECIRASNLTIDDELEL